MDFKVRGLELQNNKNLEGLGLGIGLGGVNRVKDRVRAAGVCVILFYTPPPPKKK